jgi:hypothetical protein
MSNIRSIGLGCGGKSIRDLVTAFSLIASSPKMLANSTVAFAGCSILPAPARHTFAPLDKPTKQPHR